MFSLMHPTLFPAARSSSARIMMSTLAPGQVLRGARWNYHPLEPMRGGISHTSNVYKAKIDARHDDIDAPQWAIIKAANDEITKMNLNRELGCYRLPVVASAPCFRRLYDVIDDSTIALEWLDTTLEEVKYQPNLHIYTLIKKVLHAALTSSVFLGEQEHLNMDYKPANMLLSGVGTDDVIAKVGDFRHVLPANILTHIQPFDMRAPEAFFGDACDVRKVCNVRSQVWTVAAMILVWIKPGILGLSGCPDPIAEAAWCLAKVKRLFPYETRVPPGEGDVLQALIDVRPELRAVSTFEEETEAMGLPQEIKDVLRLMLVPDVIDRPSPSSVLASAEFLALEKLVGV